MANMAKLNFVQRRPSYLSLYSKARRLEQAEEEKTDEENIEEVTDTHFTPFIFSAGFIDRSTRVVFFDILIAVNECLGRKARAEVL